MYKMIAMAEILSSRIKKLQRSAVQTVRPGLRIFGFSLYTALSVLYRAIWNNKL